MGINFPLHVALKQLEDCLWLLKDVPLNVTLGMLPRGALQYLHRKGSTCPFFLTPSELELEETIPRFLLRCVPLLLGGKKHCLAVRHYRRMLRVYVSQRMASYQTHTITYMRAMPRPQPIARPAGQGDARAQSKRLLVPRKAAEIRRCLYTGLVSGF